jgi:hypothetical protein
LVNPNTPINVAQNFSASQSLGELSTLTLTDTSTGLGSYTSRLIYIQKQDGTYLVPSGTITDFIEWAAASSTKDIEDLLDRDYALLVTIKWLNGSTIAYTKVLLYCFTGYTREFLLDLSRAQAANPALLNSKNYFSNKLKLRCLVEDADELVELADDQTGAQLCLNQAKELTDNQVYFF